MRHGIAEDFSLDGKDSSRKLTQIGKIKVQEVASVLKQQLHHKIILVNSPYLRAAETADILEDNLEITTRLEHDEFTPESFPSESFQTLSKISTQYADANTLIMVGHQPNISSLSGICINNDFSSPIRFGRATAAILECNSDSFKAGEFKVVNLINQN
jgi:phosphohistidine phosphatase